MNDFKQALVEIERCTHNARAALEDEREGEFRHYVRQIALEAARLEYRVAGM